MENKFNSTEETKEKIKSTCNIVDIISAVVPLKKQGINHKGLCPFHGEKTPSFVVSEDKQVFKCFGCGISGDLFTFVQKYYNLSFPEAIEKLANEYNIPIKYNVNIKVQNQHKDILKEICREAAILFYKYFKSNGGETAREYMQNRNIKSDTLREFGIGFAPDSWDFLKNSLIKKGYREEDLLEVGLLNISEKKEKNNDKKTYIYDNFRNRVMFPIKDKNGKVIGFGGRTMEKNPKGGKYLNSKESLIFLKKNNLYGLYSTGKYIRMEKFAILVEGYMDLISLYQVGIRNCVASLGTAFTEEQAKLLSFYTDNVYISYDGDNAGISAALKAGDILRKNNFKVGVIIIPQEKDPDEFIKLHGITKFKEVIKTAIPYPRFYINQMARNRNLTIELENIEFLKDVSNYLNTLPYIEAMALVDGIVDDYKFSKAVLIQNLENNYQDNKISIKNEKIESNEQYSSISKNIDKNKFKVDALERSLILIMLYDNTYITKVVEVNDKYEEFGFFRSRWAETVFEVIQEQFYEKGLCNINLLKSELSNEDYQYLLSTKENTLIDNDLDMVFKSCINGFDKKVLNKKMEKIIDLIALAEGQEDLEEINRLNNELQNLQRILRK